MLEIEVGAQVRESVCQHCGRSKTVVTGFMYRDGDAYVVYYASCYDHDGPEVWIDVVFSPNWEDDAAGRYTFGCRIGAVDGPVSPAASLVPAAAAFSTSKTFGHKLTRDEALVHPALPEFWAVVDHIVEHDAVVVAHLDS
ncbi:hypothetical protein [Kribbella hippodromi]|uniref:hypothetical protein n=1 Tax=Kribbella hippodromi TaxID=434347 RepID=UPI0031CE64D8